MIYFFFQAEDGIRDVAVTGVQTCALPIWDRLLADGEGWADEKPDGQEQRLHELPHTPRARSKFRDATNLTSGRGRPLGDEPPRRHLDLREIGRASCRERV